MFIGEVIAEGISTMPANISKDEFVKHLTDAMQEKGKEFGIDKDQTEKLVEIVKKQGEAISSLREHSGDPLAKQTAKMKNAFYKNFDALKDAIKNKTEDFTIRAINEHDPDKIQTTENTVTGTTNENLLLMELIGEDTELHLKRRSRQYIRDIANINIVETVRELLTFWEEGDEDGAFAVVAENGLKPQVHLSLIKNVVEAQKVAGYIVVTEELVKFRQRAWGFIQRLFRRKIMRDYEDLLTNILSAYAVPYTGSALDGTIPAPSDLDAIIAAIAQAEALDFMPNTLVISPADKWRIVRLTTSTGQFLLPYIPNNERSFSILGLNVITSTKVPVGTFKVGEAGVWNVNEEAPTIRTGTINDDIVHNRFCVVGELWFQSWVASNDIGAWVEGNFDDIKEALQQ